MDELKDRGRAESSDSVYGLVYSGAMKIQNDNKRI